MNKSTKYTKERLEPIVKESLSLAEVIRKLNIKWSGGQQQNIKRWINIYGLDTSHFLGQRHNKNKVCLNKLHWSKILILKPDNNRREDAGRLRRALIESGREYKCERCNNTGHWLDEEITLQVDHKNGNWLDNQKENLRFLCPNCHSQTPGWSGRKEKQKRIKKEPKTTDPLWRVRPKLERRKVERPSYDQLLQEVNEIGFLGVGRKYGVSDNAVRKWIKNYEKW